MLVFKIVLCLLFIIASFRVVKYLVKCVDERRKFLKIPGPPENFIFGHLPILMRFKPDIMFKYLRDMAHVHWPFYRISSFVLSSVNVLVPEDIEICIAGTKHLDKGYLYMVLHEWLGTGLLTSTGSKWQTRRKILTPAFHFSILQEFLPIFNDETEKLVSQLEDYVDKPYVEILPHVTQMALQSISESAMGFTDIEEKSASEYKTSIYKIVKIYLRRLRFPWFMSSLVYYQSSLGKQELALVKILHGFTKKVIIQRERNYEEIRVKTKSSDNSYFGRKRLAMLDLLLAAKKEGSLIDNEGIREEVDTFMFEGHDTITAAMTYLIFCLGCYTDVQQRVLEEICEVMGSSERSPSYNDLQELKYTERVIKEALRLYPSVPYISRTATESFTTSTGYFIPKGTLINIHIFDMHRHPSIYPDPLKFDPDRFLPENCQNRHPFAYLPFSAGPRNCIGQRFAILELKAALCGILRKFQLEAVDTPADLKFFADLILRTDNEIKIKIKYRK